MLSIDLLITSIENPLILSFIFIWVLGWCLKNKTKIDNRRIPLILIPIGILLGLFIIETSVKGIVTGILIALLQMGGYDLFKNIVDLIKYVNTNNKASLSKKLDKPEKK